MATHSSILGLENLMDRGAWWAAVPGVAKSTTEQHTHTHTYLMRFCKDFKNWCVRNTWHNALAEAHHVEQVLRVNAAAGAGFDLM